MIDIIKYIRPIVLIIGMTFIISMITQCRIKTVTSTNNKDIEITKTYIKNGYVQVKMKGYRKVIWKKQTGDDTSTCSVK